MWPASPPAPPVDVAQALLERMLVPKMLKNGMSPREAVHEATRTSLARTFKTTARIFE